MGGPPAPPLGPPPTRLLRALLSWLGWMGGPSLPGEAGELQPDLHGNGFAGCLSSAGAPPPPGLQEVGEKDGEAVFLFFQDSLQAWSLPFTSPRCYRCCSWITPFLVSTLHHSFHAQGTQPSQPPHPHPGRTIWNPLLAFCSLCPEHLPLLVPVSPGSDIGAPLTPGLCPCPQAGGPQGPRRSHERGECPEYGMMKGCLCPHLRAVCGGEWCLGANRGVCAPTSTGGLSMLGVGEGEWRFPVS